MSSAFVPDIITAISLKWLVVKYQLLATDTEVNSCFGTCIWAQKDDFNSFTMYSCNDYNIFECKSCVSCSEVNSKGYSEFHWVAIQSVPSTFSTVLRLTSIIVFLIHFVMLQCTFVQGQSLTGLSSNICRSNDCWYWFILWYNSNRREQNKQDLFSAAEESISDFTAKPSWD